MFVGIALEVLILKSKTKFNLVFKFKFNFKNQNQKSLVAVLCKEEFIGGSPRAMLIVEWKHL